MSIQPFVPSLATTLCHACGDTLSTAIETSLRQLCAATGAEFARVTEYDDAGAVVRAYEWRDAGANAAGASEPIVVQGSAGAVSCSLTIHRSHAGDRPAPPAHELHACADLFAWALLRRHDEAALHRAEAELADLHARLDRESEPDDTDTAVTEFDEIVGRSATLRTALVRLHEVSRTHSSVLLLGETGTGKELFARAIHTRGPRRASPMVVVNCAALPATLIESELFGHARGAFTGAITARQGRFELAHRGTLFLDEIGDLPLDLQTKLLRVLQEGTFERLGSSQTIKVDVRIIAATHRDLRKAVADGRFRDDLYYRLSVFPIRIPSLRERRVDIPYLVWFIIHKRQRAMQRAIKRIPNDVMQALQRYDWPGNVRELENVIERALIHSTGDTLALLDDNLLGTAEEPAAEGTLSAVERAHISEVLDACGWRINGAGNAAERLGMHPNTLRFRMKKLGIVRPAGSHVALDDCATDGRVN